MSKEDLIPINKRTKREAKEISQKGGIASGKSRRVKRDMRASLLMFGEFNPKPETVSEILATHKQISGKDLTLTDALSVKMWNLALEGNTKAAEFIRDTTGQKPADKLTVETEPPTISDDVPKSKKSNKGK